MADFVRFFYAASRQLHRFRRHEGGTMALLMGLAAVPIIFSVGAGVDYSTANMVKTKLQAVADAAALSAVDHTEISDAAANAQAVATTVFNAEAVNLKNVTITSLNVTVTDSNTGRPRSLPTPRPRPTPSWV
jgi:Flp pilus assembly protein TadG